MKTAELLEVLTTEIPPAARQYAQEIFEGLNQQITAQIEERITDFLAAFQDSAEEDQLEQIARDIVQPAFSYYVAGRLMYLFGHSSMGWNEVYWTNMREKYHREGP